VFSGLPTLVDILTAGPMLRQGGKAGVVAVRGDEHSGSEDEVEAELALLIALHELPHLRHDIGCGAVRQGRGFGVASTQHLAALVQSLEQLDGVVQILVAIAGYKLLAQRGRFQHIRRLCQTLPVLRTIFCCILDDALVDQLFEDVLKG